MPTRYGGTGLDLQPGLMLVHGNRAEQLRDVLVAWLRGNPLGPLENECLLVHSNGIAQWLRLALAECETGCGVAAALDFLLPSRFIWQAYRAVLGEQSVPADSPMDKDPLTWRLMRLLPELAGQPEYAPLRRYLTGDGDGRKRYQLAGRLADLFDQYQVYRADWLQAWGQGRAVLPDAAGRDEPLDEENVWQARLWRALLDDLGAPDVPQGRAAIHEAFMARVRALPDGPRPAGLPRRVLVFGISSMPRQTLEALAALARWVQILMCVNNPCAHYWADIQGSRDILRTRFRRQQRRPGLPQIPDEALLHQQSQPLLASWGRQGRDFIGLLDDFDDPGLRARGGRALAELHHRIDSFEALPGRTLLEQIQDDIRDLRPLSESRARWPAVDTVADGSVRFHIAHSAQREVEILHDQLLADFAADPSLQPRDVIVMVPDVEAYAPHVQAVFGLHEAQDWRHIPFALADRGQRHADPLVIVLERLLSLPGLRLGLQEVLEWLDVPAVRDRFGIAADDLPLLQRWARESNVRWGLDARQRTDFGLEQTPRAAHRYTWAFGLERMLLGYAAGAEAGPWQDIAPYDEPGGLQAAALGALAHFVERIGHYWELLRDPVPPEVWVARCRALLDDFFSPATDEDAHTLLRFRECLQDWLQVCEQTGLDEALPLSIVAEHCLGRLDQQGLSQRFFAGAVTFATLMPMRAVPFRRVCLLGLQDGAFPRTRVPADFDLMASHPRPGDRSRREDDRYLFLEALLSARDQFYVSWVGRDIHDNAEQAPSVLVSQLMEHLDNGWRCQGAETSVSKALTCVHPLQPFSRRYFEAGAAPGPQALFTYASEWRDRSAPTGSTASAVLAPRLVESPLGLTTLSRFLRHPIKAFMQQRLRVRFDLDEPIADDAEPYALDGLQEWQLRQTLLDGLQRAGGSRGLADLYGALDRDLARLQRQGDLLDGALGDRAIVRLRQVLEAPLADFSRACADWPEAVSEAFRMESCVAAEPGGADLVFTDTLSGWRRNAAGEWCRIRLLASDLVDGKDHYRLAPMLEAWVEHVCAHVHGRPVTTVLISPKGRVEWAAADGPGDERTWQSLWSDLWSAWRQGLCSALPVEAHAAGVWLRVGQPADPQDDGWAQVRTTYEERMSDDLYLRRCYPDFDSLVAGGAFFDWARTLYGALSATVSGASGGRGKG
ncbi:exodeoxyribonuclease V subunit gamma [Castellaniella sp. UC4442_H9]